MLKGQMTNEPSLVLTHSFEFRGRLSTYTISFYQNSLTVCDTKDAKSQETIKYTDVYKIRSSERHLRILFRDDSTIAVPCTIQEMRSIKKLFKKSSSFSTSRVSALAFVEFGDLSFFTKFDSNHFSAFKIAVIKRIAKYFYPAFDQEGISLDLFDKFVFRVRKDNRLVNIECSEDLDAVHLRGS